MPQQSNLDKQIGWLENDVNANKHLEAYPLWLRLVGVLASMGNGLDAMIVLLRGDGNGNKGIQQRLTSVEGIMKSMQSDIRELRTMVRISLGYEHDPEALEHLPRFSADDNPGRRAEDKVSTFDKVVKYFVRYILPPLIVSAILGGFAFWIAVNNHLLTVP